MAAFFGDFGMKSLDSWQEFQHDENGNPNSGREEFGQWPLDLGDIV